MTSALVALVRAENHRTFDNGESRYMRIKGKFLPIRCLLRDFFYYAAMVNDII